MTNDLPIQPRVTRTVCLLLALGFLLAPARPALADGPVSKGPIVAALPAGEAQGLLRLGDQVGARGDYGTAELAYWQILRQANLKPNDEKAALLGLAHMLRKEGSLTKAAAIYEKFVKEFPSDERVPDALLDLGRTLRDMGAYKTAISRFYSVINSTLKFPPAGFEHYQLLAKTAQFEIAQTHFVAGEYAAASKYFLRVSLLDLAPVDRARAEFMAARAQAMSGNDEESVLTLHKFLADYPADENAAEARFLLATTLRKLNRPDEALGVTLDLLREEHKRDENDTRRWAYWQKRTGNEVANQLFQSGNPSRALAIYRGLQRLSDDPEWQLSVAYQIALCEERGHMTVEAKSDYQKIVDRVKERPAGRPLDSATAELGRMAGWRLEQIAWQEKTEEHLDGLFAKDASAGPDGGKPPAAPAPRS